MQSQQNALEAPGYSKIVTRMRRVTDELGLETQQDGRKGWLYWSKGPNAPTRLAGSQRTRGVGIFWGARGVEFNFDVLLGFGQDQIANAVIARLKEVGAEAEGGPECLSVPCAALLQNWQRTRRDIIEPYFRAWTPYIESTSGASQTQSESIEQVAPTMPAVPDPGGGGLRGEEEHLLLVASTAEPIEKTDASFRNVIEPLMRQHRKVAYPWKVRLLKDKLTVLAEWPYFYLYAPSPIQALIYRMHVQDFDTTAQSSNTPMPCPWPEYSIEDYSDWTAEGGEDTDEFKTWFLIDHIERLNPNIPLCNLQDAEGRPAKPWSLVPSYGLWRLRRPYVASDRAARAETELADIERLVRGTGGGQGFATTAAARRAIEMHAMDVAEQH